MSLHWDVNCDGCGSTSLNHYRFKCLRCPDYDLCRMCHENGVSAGMHDRRHPFQCLLDRAARELHFAGEPMADLCADSFTCPVCGNLGHSAGELVKHVQTQHRSDRTSVICPLCVAVPSAHPNRLNNIAGHLAVMHPSSILRSSADENPPSITRSGEEEEEQQQQHLPIDPEINPVTFQWQDTPRPQSQPSAQVPHVRFVLPGTPPLAGDISDSETVEL